MAELVEAPGLLRAARRTTGRSGEIRLAAGHDRSSPFTGVSIRCSNVVIPDRRRRLSEIADQKRAKLLDDRAVGDALRRLSGGGIHHALDAGGADESGRVAVEPGGVAHRPCRSINPPRERDAAPDTLGLPVQRAEPGNFARQHDGQFGRHAVRPDDRLQQPLDVSLEIARFACESRFEARSSNAPNATRHRRDQRLAVREILIERADADACPFGNAIGRHPREAVLHQNASGGVPEWLRQARAIVPAAVFSVHRQRLARQPRHPPRMRFYNAS